MSVLSLVRRLPDQASADAALRPAVDAHCGRKLDATDWTDNVITGVVGGAREEDLAKRG